jgi:hypothetical protein
MASEPIPDVDMEWVEEKCIDMLKRGMDMCIVNLLIETEVNRYHGTPRQYVLDDKQLLAKVVALWEKNKEPDVEEENEKDEEPDAKRSKPEPVV